MASLFFYGALPPLAETSLALEHPSLTSWVGETPSPSSSLLSYTLHKFTFYLVHFVILVFFMRLKLPQGRRHVWLRKEKLRSIEWINKWTQCSFFYDSCTVSLPPTNIQPPWKSLLLCVPPACCPNTCLPHYDVWDTSSSLAVPHQPSANPAHRNTVPAS